MELLAPAGNLEKLKIAFAYGADAAYLAGQEFGLRSAADNFSLEELQKAMQLAHRQKKKVYLAMNAILHNHELEALPEYLHEIRRTPPSAIICSDLGVMRVVAKHTKIPIHVSTQASVLNSYYASMLADYGAKRVVVGRELSLQGAEELKEKTGLEVEVFGHGALCMSYSGHCTISNYTAGRDSNRGGCIQNCRFQYSLKQGGKDLKDSYFMSSKDLNSLSLLPDFLTHKIDALKIEGRMKSSLYIASVVRAYRGVLDALEAGKAPDYEHWQEEVKKIPHRDYTEGSLEKPAGASSVYDRQDELVSPYEMAGIVLEVNKNKGAFAFQAKNRLKLGEEIEIMPFHGPQIKMKLDAMESLKGEAMDVAQAQQVFWLPWQEGIEAMNQVRFQRWR